MRAHRLARASMLAAILTLGSTGVRAETARAEFEVEAPSAASAADSSDPAQAENMPVPERAAAPPLVAPEQPSIEVSVMAGSSVVFSDPANPEYVRSYRRVGGLAEIGVAYRSSYFVDPFLSVSYADLASGESQLPDGQWGPGGTLDQHLKAWVIAPGITSDIWRFRLRFALGLAVVAQSLRFRGQEHSSTQLPLANQLGIGFNALDTRRFRLDAEARAIVAPGADITYVSMGVVARGDLVQFGR